MNVEELTKKLNKIKDKKAEVRLQDPHSDYTVKLNFIHTQDTFKPTTIILKS
jgi:hypothetical protein